MRGAAPRNVVYIPETGDNVIQTMSRWLADATLPDFFIRSRQENFWCPRICFTEPKKNRLMRNENHSGAKLTLEIRATWLRSAFWWWGAFRKCRILRDEQTSGDFCVRMSLGRRKKATEKKARINNKNNSQNPFLQHIEKMYSLFKIIIRICGAPKEKINIIITPSSISWNSHFSLFSVDFKEHSEDLWSRINCRRAKRHALHRDAIHTVWWRKFICCEHFQLRIFPF